MRAAFRVDASGRLLGVLLLGLALAALAAPAAQAQPFGVWVTFTGQPTLGYINIPGSNPSLTGSNLAGLWTSDRPRLGHPTLVLG
jgi:hypothetical protein